MDTKYGNKTNQQSCKWCSIIDISPKTSQPFHILQDNIHTVTLMNSTRNADIIKIALTKVDFKSCMSKTPSLLLISSHTAP